jgi:hypothetical protein
VGAERRHEHEVVVGVPESGLRTGVQVRGDRPGEQKRGESDQERKDPASCHGA